MAPALVEAFEATDRDLEQLSVTVAGSTAAVAVVSPNHIWFAHAGDSRALLVRNGTVVASTSDHRAERDDERERVEAAGGAVMYHCGALRVGGQLQTTRAIGDHDLRGHGVTPRPEVVALPRCGGGDSDCELLILATDGLWDRMSLQEAARMAATAFRKVQLAHAAAPGAGGCWPCKAAKVAATGMARCARSRGSGDDITVVVADVSHQCTCGRGTRDHGPLPMTLPCATRAPGVASRDAAGAGMQAVGAAAPPQPTPFSRACSAAQSLAAMLPPLPHAPHAGGPQAPALAAGDAGAGAHDPPGPPHAGQMLPPLPVASATRSASAGLQGTGSGAPLLSPAPSIGRRASPFMSGTAAAHALGVTAPPTPRGPDATLWCAPAADAWAALVVACGGAVAAAAAGAVAPSHAPGGAAAGAAAAAGAGLQLATTLKRQLSLARTSGSCQYERGTVERQCSNELVIAG